MSPSIFLERPAAETAHQRNRTPIWLLRTWLPVCIAVLCIVAESTPTFSSEHTNGWIRPIIERLFGHIDDAIWRELHHLLRKSGHILGYGLVGLTFLRAWLLTLAANPAFTLRAWRLRSSLAAILSTAIVASGDEIHQTFLPSRTGQFSDVLLDTLGASTMCLAIGCALWLRKAPESPS